jgi:hypothetical protein
MGKTCGANEEERRVHRVLVGKLKGKKPLGRPRRKWKYIKKLRNLEGVMGTGVGSG